MKKVAGIILSVVVLLSACSSVNGPQQPDLNALGMILPGAPSSSFYFTHTFAVAGNNQKTHRATVNARKMSDPFQITPSPTTQTTTKYAADSYIPVDAYFSVDLGHPHTPRDVRATVVSNSLISKSISCTWQGDSHQVVNCSPSSTLSHNTLYTVIVEEYKSGSGWTTIATAYFRTL